MQQPRNSSRAVLLAGDAAVLAMVTLVGFARHAEMDAGARMLATFLPLLAAWLVTAPWFDQYQVNKTLMPINLVKTGLAAALAAPLAVVLRGLWLNAPIIPIFAVVMAAFSALGLILWRAAWLGFNRREARHG